MWIDIQAQRKVVIRQGQIIPSVPRSDGFETKPALMTVIFMSSQGGKVGELAGLKSLVC